MNILQSGILGLIQGLGEFLPVSSSGHLLLARIFMGLQDAPAQVQSSYKVLDILLHVGTLIPLVIVFWKDWIDMLLHPVRNKTLLYLILASIPTLLVYLGAKKLFPDVNGFDVFDSDGGRESGERVDLTCSTAVGPWVSPFLLRHSSCCCAI